MFKSSLKSEIKRDIIIMYWIWIFLLFLHFHPEDLKAVVNVDNVHLTCEIQYTNAKYSVEKVTKGIYKFRIRKVRINLPQTTFDPFTSVSSED